MHMSSHPSVSINSVISGKTSLDLCHCRRELNADMHIMQPVRHLASGLSGMQWAETSLVLGQCMHAKCWDTTHGTFDAAIAHTPELTFRFQYPACQHVYNKKHEKAQAFSVKGALCAQAVCST